MKYIDADKLIAEIEKRKQIHKNNIENGFPDEANKITEDDNILSIISSFQQEQPVEGLEEEIGKWMVEDCGPSDFNPYADHWCADDIQRTARHFYELGCRRTTVMYDDIEYNRQSAEKAELTKGLEEEIEFYLDHAELATKCKGISAAEDYFNDLNAIARHFAEWGKNKRK